MPDDNKTQEFLQKLAPCIERGDLDACVEEAARMAQERGAGELLELQDLEGEGKAISHYNAGLPNIFYDILKVGVNLT